MPKTQEQETTQAVTNAEIMAQTLKALKALTNEVAELKKGKAPVLGLAVTKSPDQEVTGGVAKLPELNNADVVFYTSKKGQNGALLVRSKTETVLNYRGLPENLTAYIPGLFLATGKPLPASQQIIALGEHIKKALYMVDCCEQLLEKLGVKPLENE